MTVTTFKVAEVLNDTTVAINAGLHHGIEVGMKFILIGIGKDIVDPETQENLGPLELVRGRVTVTHVQERICTAESNQQSKVPGRKRIITRPNSPFSAMLGAGREEIEEDVTYEVKHLDGVKIGDIAKRY
jgi:hypothetical protein